jgi:hypothetical protein
MWITLLFVLLAGGAAAQTTNERQNLDAKAAPSPPPRLIEPSPVEPNRVTGKRYSVSGIAVQAVKTRRVFQLLNPVAPPRYFAGNANTVRDPKSGRVEGLKLMSLEF